MPPLRGLAGLFWFAFLPWAHAHGYTIWPLRGWNRSPVYGAGGSTINSMRRTFTLAGLMVGITVFCILCGLAVNYPMPALGCALVALVLIPSIIVWFLMMRRSRQPVALTVGSLIGIGTGFCPISVLVHMF